MDIVENGCGVLYPDPLESSLEDALRAFDRVESLIDPVQLRIRASAFSEAVFERHFRAALNRCRSGCPPGRPGAAQAEPANSETSTRTRLFGYHPPILGQPE
jgi:hypothetical protein